MDAERGLPIGRSYEQRPTRRSPPLLTALGLRTDQHPLREEALARAPPLDGRADGAELLLQPLISAIEVVDAKHLGLAFGGKPGEHQAHRCAKVCRHDAGAGQLLNSSNNCRTVMDVDILSKASKLENVQVS